MVTYWNLFFFMALALFAGLVYYFTVGEDIVRTLTDQAVPLHLLVLITVVVYMSIFNSLKTISREYNLREENIRMQNNEELLHLSSSVMANRIKWLLDAQKQSSITSHDHRHFNNTVLELLEQQKTEEAIACLKQQSNVKTNSLKNYCENTLVNATVSYYASLAEEKGILNEINLEIPNDLQVDSLELAMVISNLFENAIHACQELQGGNENDQELTIRFTSRHIGRLVLEISNPCKASIILDENGYPVSKEKGHGVGTKSVLAFANEYKAEIMYQIENGIFRVRMLI